LKRVLGELIDPGKERYGITWPGKADCFKTIQRPSLGTLLPCREQSVNFDTTENLLIEGDNLEVLKLLQKSFLGKIKLIYIDPPYNTGNDFIYPDNYSESLQTYLEYTGQVDIEGRRFSTNTEADGRFHSKWLSMMYPRLYLARNLLRDNGAIFISIDQKEVDNLKKLCNEIVGEENHVADLVWAQNTSHSQSPLYSTTHEYVIVYGRDAERLQANPDTFREPKPGCKEVLELVEKLTPQYPNVEYVKNQIQSLMAEHKKQYENELRSVGLPLDEDTEKQDPWRGVYAYKYVEYRDDMGRYVDEEHAQSSRAHLVVWQSDNASAPAAKQAASTLDPSSANYRFYKPMHPETGKPCPCPKRGWAWPKSWPDDSRETFDRVAANNRIVWGGDESTVPRYKRFLHEVETNVAKTVIYDYTDGEKQVAELLGRPALYPNPKPTTLISRFITHVCSGGDIILDFFAGSGTTAHAVFQHNAAADNGCRFVLVQLPERIDPTNKDQEAAAKFCDDIGRPRTISEIMKERVRRAAKTFSSIEHNLLTTMKNEADLGFRVFRLAESCFKPWNAPTPDSPHDLSELAVAKQLELHINHIRQERGSEDVLYELLAKSGFPLSARIGTMSIEGKTVYSVANGQMFICLERELTTEVLRQIAEKKPWRVICLDEAFAGNDQVKTNAVQIMKAKGVTSFRTV
jgi:adenine-specific DNA-methyltransferase